MWSIDVPSITTQEVAEACVSRVKDEGLVRGVLDSRSELERNRVTFGELIAARTLHGLTTQNVSVKNVSDDQFRWLYKQHMAQSRGGARDYYDQLLSNARFKLCSYCQYGYASTLDHFVPKNKFGGLAIEPSNLVPACPRCNQTLSTATATSAEEQMFHPYSENVSGRWLFAEVIEEEYGALRFMAKPSDELETQTKTRIQNQFQALKLDLLYGAVTGRDVAEARRTLNVNPDLGKPHSAQTASELLKDIATNAFLVDENSLRGVTYEALSESNWFCSQQ